MDIDDLIKGRVDDLKILWGLNDSQIEHLTKYFNQVVLATKINTMDECCAIECDGCRISGKAVKPANQSFWIHQIKGKTLLCTASDLRDKRSVIF